MINLLFLLVGYPYARLIARHGRLEQWSLAFLLGSGLLTFVWFALYLLNIPLGLTSLFVAAMILFVIGSIATSKVAWLDRTNAPTKLSALDRILIIMLIVLVLCAVAVAIYQPVTSWDALTLYDFRGLVISQTHSLAEVETSTYYLSYPLMTSLVHAATYLTGDSHPQIFYAFTYLALMGIIYGRMADWTSTRYALITTWLVASSQFIWEHATIAYTNLPYTAFLLAGFFYAPASLLMSGVLLGLSTWVRISEPFWLVGILLIFYFGLAQKRWFQTIMGIIAAFSIRYTWVLYLHAAYARIQYVASPVTSVYNLALPAKVWSHWGPIISYIYNFIFTPYLSYWLVSLFALLSLPLLISQLVKTKEILILQLSSWLISGMVIAGIAIFSTYYTSWYSIGGSATRMILFMTPLIIVIAVRIYHYLESCHGHK